MEPLRGISLLKKLCLCVHVSCVIQQRLFGEVIVCLTVGSGGEIEFDRPGYANHVHYTKRRSAYAMSGEARKDWYHSRKERARDNQQTTCYSVTFRTIRLNDDRPIYAIDDVPDEAARCSSAPVAGAEPATTVAVAATASSSIENQWSQAHFDSLVREHGRRHAFVEIAKHNREWIMRDDRLPLALSLHLTVASLLDAPILVPSQGVEPQVYLWSTSTDRAARRCHADVSRFGRVDCLQFGNCRGVGGGYQQGDSTQEEEGMRVAPELYASLARTTYSFDYRSELKYTLGAEIVRDSTKGYEFLPIAERFRANFITAAAPDLRFPKMVGGDRWDDGEMYALVHAILRTPLAVPTPSTQLPPSTLILGAFGSGSFGNDPTQVAMLFVSALKTSGKYYRHIVFAIPDASSDDYQAYERTLFEAGIRFSSAQ
jgi:uncharacterized protein (TIGR02452 family)